MIASLGALLGIVLLPQFFDFTSVKRHREAIWFVLMLAAVAYFQLSPFDWIGLSELPGRFSKIEWLPFKSYYYAEPISALFDLQKKVYWFILLGFFARTLASAHAPGGSRLKPALLCGVIAVGLEFAQIGLQSRIPSTGDMIIFSLSAWAGIVLFDWINSIEQINSSGSIAFGKETVT